jgi:Holliday junction resolvase RusA-like endonuclease
MIFFTVPGNPKPQGRPVFARHGKFVQTYDPATSRDFKSKVAFFARIAMQKEGLSLFTEAVVVRADFYFVRPKRLLKKKIQADAILHDKKGDLDNLLKAIFDAMNGIVWKDDGQVCVVGARKFYCEKDREPRTEVEVG